MLSQVPDSVHFVGVASPLAIGETVHRAVLSLLARYRVVYTLDARMRLMTLFSQSHTVEALATPPEHLIFRVRLSAAHTATSIMVWQCVRETSFLEDPRSSGKLSNDSSITIHWDFTILLIVLVLVPQDPSAQSQGSHVRVQLPLMSVNGLVVLLHPLELIHVRALDIHDHPNQAISSWDIKDVIWRSALPPGTIDNPVLDGYYLQ